MTLGLSTCTTRTIRTAQITTFTEDSYISRTRSESLIWVVGLEC